MRSDTYANSVVGTRYSLLSEPSTNRTQHLLYQTVNANLTQTSALYQVMSVDGITCLL